MLFAATRHGAHALHRDTELGTIEREKLADIVLVRGAPWTNIAEARNVVAVVQGGHIVVDRR